MAVLFGQRQQSKQLHADDTGRTMRYACGLAQTPLARSRSRHAPPPHAHPRRRSLGVALRVFGSRHPAVAAETNVLAVFLVEHGRNREAEACYRQSMEIWERTLGPYSPELASGLNNLAILLFMEDRPGWVFPDLLQQSVAVCRADRFVLFWATEVVERWGKHTRVQEACFRCSVWIFRCFGACTKCSFDQSREGPASTFLPFFTDAARHPPLEVLC